MKLGASGSLYGLQSQSSLLWDVSDLVLCLLPAGKRQTNLFL